MSVIYNNIIDIMRVYEEYDAMELIHGDNYELFHSGFIVPNTEDEEKVAGMFNTWDADSICIWNPEIIGTFAYFHNISRNSRG